MDIYCCGGLLIHWDQCRNFIGPVVEKFVSIGLFLPLPYFVRVNQAVETKRPWHGDPSPPTPSGQNHQPDTPNRRPTPLCKWWWRDRGFGGVLGHATPPTTSHITSNYDVGDVQAEKSKTSTQQIAAATPRSTAEVTCLKGSNLK